MQIIRTDSPEGSGKPHLNELINRLDPEHERTIRGLLHHKRAQYQGVLPQEEEEQLTQIAVGFIAVQEGRERRRKMKSE